MKITTKIALAAAMFAAVATSALAQDDEWTVDSGRYVAGQVPSYGAQAPLHAFSQPRLIEGRNAAIVSQFGTNNGTTFGRDAQVQTLGN
jgi:hypothetical protein